MPHGTRLSERTAFLRRDLGPCVLVVKCSELLEIDPGELRNLAASVVRGEVERLAEARRRRLGDHSVCHHYVRSIYVSDVAGYRHDRQVLFAALVEFLRQRRRAELSGDLSFLLASAAIFAEEAPAALALLSAETVGAVVLSAIVSNNPEATAAAIEILSNSIRSAESEMQLVPWDDVWEYVILHRLQRGSGTRERD